MDSRLLRWRPLTTSLLVGGVILILIVSAVSYIAATFQPKTEVQLGNGVYHLKIANTAATREKGLSGVKELQPNAGLLMIYEEDGFHQIWMKDMLIPIDIVWLDANKKVVHMVTDTSPDQSTKVIFTPRKQARYIIELQSGSIRQQNIRLGQEATFDEKVVSLWW